MDEDYKTSDLGVAAALYATGLKLENIDKTNVSRAVFHFVSNGDIHAIVSTYWDGSLKLPARGYYASIKELKARLYA